MQKDKNSKNKKSNCWVLGRHGSLSSNGTLCSDLAPPRLHHIDQPQELLVCEGRWLPKLKQSGNHSNRCALNNNNNTTTNRLPGCCSVRFCQWLHKNLGSALSATVIITSQRHFFPIGGFPTGLPRAHITRAWDSLCWEVIGSSLDWSADTASAVVLLQQR